MIETPAAHSPMHLIISVLEDYADWYGHVVRRVFYPEADNMMNPVPAPKSFAAWREHTLTNQSLDIGELDRITKIHKDLQNFSDKLISESFRDNRRPEYEAFNEFSNLFDDLLQRLRRVEADYYLSGRGYDAVTGLRNQHVMMTDLAREMERVARRGRAFSLVMAKIDDADILREQLGDGFDQMLGWIGQGVLTTIRTFDDAYRFNDTEFLMSLKHADIQGAQRFVDRLRAYFTANPLVIVGRPVHPSMSFVVAEPIGEEDLPRLIEQLRKDLSKAGQDGDAVVRYEEVSPLQRYLSEGGGS